MKPFGRGSFESGDEFYAVNVACLDDAAADELSRAPGRYEDGRNDRWESPPAETGHL